MNNGGPFRESRPVDRRASGRSEQQGAPVSRQPDEPQPVVQPERPVPQQSTARPDDTSKSKKRLKLPLLLLALIVIAAAGWFVWSKTQDTKTAIDTSKYQGVWLANGEIYFGKLESLNGGYFKLNDVFYIKPQSADGTKETETKQSASNQNNFELFKLGKEEIHGPEDVMMISKDQVLYYENLKAEGKVVQGIEKYNSSNE